MEAPDRNYRIDDFANLITLEKDGRKPSPAVPTSLKLKDILECPSMFQPRWRSMLWRGRSDEHVKELARILEGGRPLDAIDVVSFGDKWFVIDGHHRLEAYKRAKWKELIAVQVHSFKEEGEDRIKAAELLSIKLNVKDKLPMNSFDKLDSAWRMTALYGDGISKANVSQTASVSTSSVSSMRRVRKLLLASEQHSIDELAAMPWQYAQWTLLRLQDPKHAERQSGDQNEHEVMLVARAMSEILRRGLDTKNIVEAFYRIDSSLVGSLESALAEWREDQRMAAALGI